VERHFCHAGALRLTGLCGVTLILPCSGFAASDSQGFEYSLKSVALVTPARYAVKSACSSRSVVEGRK
jgi:hypothetical protein